MFLAGGAKADGGGYKSGCLNLSGHGGDTRTRMYLKCTWRMEACERMGAFVFSKGMESNGNGEEVDGRKGSAVFRQRNVLAKEWAVVAGCQEVSQAEQQVRAQGLAREPVVGQGKSIFI